MSDGAGNWCLIESDPGVFTELIREFGVKGVQVEELYSLDENAFQDLKSVYGLIFLFKWRADEQTDGEFAPEATNVFFAQQVIQNACASQAIINLLLNCENPDIELGNCLSEFRNFTYGFDPATRGLSLSNCEKIRKVHNSFARENYVEIDFGKGNKDDTFHFITYVPKNGKVYELDGLQEAPICVGTIDENGDWLSVVRPVINKRIERYSLGEIHFNLMAVIADRKLKSEKRLEELMESGMDSEETAHEICHLQNVIMEEEEKNRRYKLENARRRHNYTPFIVELLKILAKEGKLISLVEKSIEETRGKKDEEATKTVKSF